ncbi:MAG TPA: transcriptional repressor [Syntrophomonadaceae bacterium]|nr:transcriptional repressor [Syntrophomonadaceae bacterium]
MDPTFEDLRQELKTKNIGLSHQRLKVLEYLAQNRCHPTVDQIYTELQKDIPTLSKTTVYNTLRILAEAGLVKVISIEDKECRFDIDTEDHGHFKCESCGTIFDFPVDIDSLIPEELSNFKINDKNVYFKGLCPGCLSNKKEIN